MRKIAEDTYYVLAIILGIMAIIANTFHLK